MNAEHNSSAITVIDGVMLKELLEGGMNLLEVHRQEVDNLNVFPVPDGDTGANMLLTLQSAWREIEPQEPQHAGELLRTFARGAIRGARGNSGVILSQIFRGMAESADQEATLNARSLARAFRQAQRTAYQGVMQPVEGTILTIIRAIADASEHAAALSDDVAFLLETVLSKARETLARTPEMLDVLREAGVVDAGGAGLVYFMEGLTRVIRGEDIDIAAALPASVQSAPRLEALDDEWGYDIQFLVYDAQASEEDIRQKLIEMGGESIVVGRAGNVTKVHVHNENPGPFLAYGASLGQMDDIVVENMTLQTLRRQGKGPVEGADQALQPSGEEVISQNACTNIIAVAPGQGLREIFKSLGACQVVAGGQSMNPSTDDLLQALARTPRGEVIILPNNKNIIMAAKQAAELADKKVFVVETRTIPQGIAAMFAYNPQLDAQQNARTMQEMAAQVHTIEVTRAVRDAKVNGVKVHEGDAIAITDGNICCTDSTPEEVALQAVTAIEAEEEGDVITLYVGLPADPERARWLAEQLSQRYPDQEVEILRGDQPHYHYIISVE